MRDLRNNPLTGAIYFLRGFALMWRPGIRRYVIVPLVLNVTVFAAVIYLGADAMWSLLEGMLPEWLEWLAWLLVPVFLVLALLIGFFAFNMMANLIAAPFNGLLAEAVERELTGRDPEDGGWRKLVRELWMTLASEVRKFVYVALRTVPLYLLLPFPVVNVLASVALVVLSAWMLAVAYVDYPMGNHGLDFREQRRRLAQRRYLGLGFGGCAMAALAVPLLNFLVIPCAVAGATAMWVEELAPRAPEAHGR